MTITLSAPTQAPDRVAPDISYKSSRKSSSKLRQVFTGCMIPLLVLAIYVVSVIFRVSAQEQKVFGRSTLIPMSLNPRPFSEIPTMETYGAFNYNIEFRGKPLLVHRQTINGFQHAFGSALVASELGAEFSDLIFRINEYVEAVFERDSSRLAHVLDTRKDLYNNAVGREISQEANSKHISGEALEDYLADEVLQAIRDRRVISHWLDAEVKSLPTSEHYGCPGLPGARH